MDLSRQLKPTISVTLVSTNHRTRRLAENFGSPSRTRIQACGNQLTYYLFIRHLVKVSEVIQLNHGESLQVKLWIVSLQLRQQIGEIVKRQFCIQSSGYV